MTRTARALAADYFRTLELFEDSLPLPPKPKVVQTTLATRDSRVLSGAIEPLPNDLETFNRAICNCVKCPLGQTRTKFVFGVGNPHARVVFVGEAPGHDEDIKGIPFVGRAGQLLDQMLAKIGLDRTHVYICNVLKCRPPNNRDPQPEEVAACKPYLMTQLSLLNPELLVCLGRHAAATLMGIESPMKDLRGRVIPWEGIKVMITYHPAYYLRNQSQLIVGDQDFRLLRQILDGEK
jgi:uracil-DNA glycosylase